MTEVAPHPMNDITLTCVKCGFEIEDHDYVHGVRGNCGNFTASEPEINDITQLSTLYSNAIARAEKAEEALRLVVAYDDLLLRYEGPSYTLFEGDVAAIDAAYDEMVAAARAAVLVEGNK